MNSNNWLRADKIRFDVKHLYKAKVKYSVYVVSL